MPKRKRRNLVPKKKKPDSIDDEEEETATPAKKVAASSTCVSEDDSSQTSSYSSIRTTEGTLGFSSHFWCNYCEFSADTKQELIAHMRQHMIKCSFCTFSSLSRAEVSRHEKCEHNEEVEVDSSSTSIDMDKDPCCACIFCEFMTYSTEYLEKHTTAKHPGLLPKSVAKMISKSVSAKVRKADALFYSALSDEQPDISSEKEKDAFSTESPTSTNAIVVEAEDKRLDDVKPHIKDIPLSDDTPTSNISSCLKLDPAEEKRAERLAKELSQTLSEINHPPDWRVKVETIYCLNCPYSNVAIDKLKCHMFSQHRKQVAIAKNNPGEVARDLSDVTLFCIKESCNHSTNTFLVYEEHLMGCCPLHQTLSKDEIERLRATLNYFSDFHNKFSIKAASGFLDFISTFHKVHNSEETSLKMSYCDKVEKKPDTRLLDRDFKPVDSGNHNSNTPVVASDQQTPHVNMSSDSSSPLPNTPPNDSNQEDNRSGLPVDNSKSVQFSGAATQVNPVHDPPPFFHQNQIQGAKSSNVQTNYQSSNIITPEISLPPQMSHGSIQSMPSSNTNISENSHRQDERPMLHINNNSQPVQGHQSLAAGQEQGMGKNMQTTAFTSNQAMNSSFSVPPFSQSGSYVNSGRALQNEQFQQNVPPPQQNIPNRQNVSFASSDSLPHTMSQSQQFQQVANADSYQSSQVPSVPNPPKMLDLLSDSYNILLDEDLDMTPTLGNQESVAMPQQSTMTNPLGSCVQQSAPSSNLKESDLVTPTVVGNLPQVSVQQPICSLPQVQQQSAMSSYSSLSHPQQTALVSQHPGVPLQHSMSHDVPVAISEQLAPSVSNLITPGPPSQAFVSHPSLNYTNTSSSTQVANSNVQHANAIVQQSSSSQSQYSSSAHSSTLQSNPAINGPGNVSASPQVLPQSQEREAHSGPYLGAQNSTTIMVDAIPNNLQTDNQNPQNQNQNQNQNTNPQYNMTSFLEPGSNINAQAVPDWQGNQVTDIPNFLVPSSSNDNSGRELNPSDPNSFSTNQDAQPELPLHPAHGTLTSHGTPGKNQSINAAKNVAGNSPLSPSIYLNGKAPRHNRSNWTNADMMPRGPIPPQIRLRANAPGNFPNPGNVRQNLFPPHQYRGRFMRGRPRGPRMQNHPRAPHMRPADDDVIVTAVVRGPPPQRSRGRPISRGLMRGQRPPLPQLPRHGARNSMNDSPQSHTKKPFDVSKHFVDLACVVNTGNDEEDNGAGDDIRIMGVTPGHSANKGPPKAVDAKKFSFCCVHCGQDQGSKQVMKQHMKADHNDSILGAFRNVETGQLLFFCPQMRCEFMSYDENRLTDHLFACYNLDKSKQLPFDLQSALKNLRSLKIRQVNTGVGMGGSQTNPIDLDGQGLSLRDTFNSNLTDAFDDMVENTIGRQMTKPNGNILLSSNSPRHPQGRHPGAIRPQRGRPIGSGYGMPRPNYQSRQPGMPQYSPGQRGHPRMPYPHPQRMAGRGNFRSVRPPSGVMHQMRGTRLSRPEIRGRAANPKPPNPLTPFGNQEMPILIDIDSENSGTPSPQNSQVSVTSSQAIIASEVSGITGLNSMVQAMAPCSNSGLAGDPPLTTSSNQGPEAAMPGNIMTTDNTSDHSNNQEPSLVTETEVLSHQIDNETKQIDETSESCSTSAIQKDQSNEETSLNSQDASSLRKQFDPEPNSYNTLAASEESTMESNEEQVNSILLTKVFAKVPHMPKKLSQRLVVRFKEFAAKRGVVITPNSKVIDEFVERISYKGSNPLSKQQQQYSQPQQQPLQHGQQQHQPQHHYHQQYDSSRDTPFHKFDQTGERFPASATCPLGVKDGSPMSDFNNGPSGPNISRSLNQRNHSPHQNIQHEPNFPPYQADTLLQQNEPHVSQHQNETNFQPDNQPRHFQHENGSNMNQSLCEPNTSMQSNQPNIFESEAEYGNGEGQNDPKFDQKESETPTSQNQNQQFQSAGNDINSDTGDEEKSDCDIIETKVILAERDLKFAGAFADIAKRKFIKSELSSSPVPDSKANVITSSAYNNTGQNVQDSHLSSLSFTSLSLDSNFPGNEFTQTLSEFVQFPKSLSEQVMINEKALKKESIPMTFPATTEGETILVHSSVDHLVTGNENLEVDIAGRPEYDNNFLSEAGYKSVVKAEKHDTINDDVETGKMTEQKEKEQEQVIGKSSGRIILKVKKGLIPRKPYGPRTNVIAKGYDAINDVERSEEHFIRRSERKRTIRQPEGKEEDAAQDQFEDFLSDGDDEYHAESDSDDSFDSDFEKGHGGKKRLKKPEDPDAFNVREKGSYMCWVCLKKFSFCLAVKKHIFQKHSKALCAIYQEDGEPNIDPHLQLLIFCPRNCKYTTLKSIAFSNHISKCQKPKRTTGENQDPSEIQNDFLSQEYVELQGKIATGALAEEIKQKRLSKSGKKKRRHHPSNSSSSGSTKDLDQFEMLATTSPDISEAQALQASFPSA